MLLLCFVSVSVFVRVFLLMLFDASRQICFEEKNLLGRNGVLGLDLRRSMASPFTSFRCC